MNPMQLLMNQLQMQMKAKNPQMFQQFQNLQKEGNDPKAIINNMIGGYKPEQINQFREFAKSFGITDEQLNNFGINVK